MKRKLLFLLPIFPLLLPFAYSQGLQYTLKVEGPYIEGSSQLDKHEKEIAVQSFAFSSEIGVQIGSGTTNNQLSSSQFGGVSCLIALDSKATPILLFNSLSGHQFAKITLTGVLTGAAATNVDLTVLEMEGVYIGAFSQQGTDGDQPLCEVIFIPEKITYKTKILDNQGQADGDAQMSWDFKEEEGTAVPPNPAP